MSPSCWIITLFTMAGVQSQMTVHSERSAVSDKSQVLQLQKSGTPSASSYAHLNMTFPALNDFTLCYKLRLNRFREESTLISYAISNNRDNEFRIDHREGGYRISLQGHWASSKLATPLRSWSTFCFTYHRATAAWTIYLDGEQRDRGTFKEKTTSLLPGGAFIIGQEQDSLGGGFQSYQSFSGEISDLNIWSFVLTSETMAQVASCNSDTEGDLLAWQSSSWVLEGESSLVSWPKTDLCRPSTRTINIFSDRFSLSQAKHLCQVVDGTILVPRSNQENTWLYQETKDESLSCSGGVGSSYLWLGASDAGVEGHWSNLATQEPLSWEGPWRGDGPNGGTEENCLVMLSGNFPGRWSDIACLDSYSFCVPCESPQPATIYLKGPAVCKHSPFSHRYLLGEPKGGKPSLQGFFHSDIYWYNGTWRLQSLMNPEMMAWWEPVKVGLYPFGTHTWTLGAEVCGLRPGTQVNLTLSACHEGEFTCTDGSCIDLEQRCDLRLDCLDQSDEVECSLLQIPPGYHNDIPPPPANFSQLLHITLDLRVIAFPSIATQDLTFTTSMQLGLKWRDRRLNYLNLKDDHTLNMLTRDAVKKIWTPTVFFTNAQGNMFSNLELGARVECVREGPSTPGPPHFSDEVNLFSGKENSLEMQQLYTALYTCDFDLIRFPFDSQVCRLRFTLVSAASSYMVLEPGVASYTGPTFLIEYQIGDISMYPTKDVRGDFSSIDVEVRFVRRYTFYLLTLYIPTTLLILIAYATFFFNPEDFNSRITVAITSLLVLTSLFTQTSNALPKTSYFKLIDVWLFFSIVVIFLVILLQTLVNFSTQSGQASRSCTMWIKHLLERLLVGERGPRKKGVLMVGHQINNSISGDHSSGDVQHSQPQYPHQENHQDQHHRHHNFIAANNHFSIHTHQQHLTSRQRETPASMRTIPPKVRKKSTETEYPRYNNSKWGPKGVNLVLLARSRILVPLIFVIFNLCYWAIALSHILPISGV